MAPARKWLTFPWGPTRLEAWRLRQAASTDTRPGKSSGGRVTAVLERSGIQKELRKRKYYEKPCEARRRAELRKQSAIRKAKAGPRKP